MATVGNMGIGYDPATGQVELTSVDDAHLLGSQATSADAARVRTVEGDGMEWLVDGGTGVTQALVADESLNVTFSAPITVETAEAELAPKGTAVAAGVDGASRLWVGVPSAGEVVPLETDKVVAAGTPPAARRLAAVRVAPPGSPVGVSIIDGQAFAVTGDAAGVPALAKVEPGSTLGRPVHLPAGARLAEQTSSILDAAGTARVDVVAPGQGGAQIVRVALDGSHERRIDLPGGADALRVDPPVSTHGATVVADPDRGRIYVVRADGSTEVHAVGQPGQHLDVQVVHGNVVVNDPGSNRVVTIDPQGRTREDRKYPDDAEAKVDAPVAPKAKTSPAPTPGPTRPSAPAAPTKPAATGKGPVGPTTTVRGAPGAPGALRAVAGKASAQLFWAPPTSGAPAATYQITCGPGCPSTVPAATVQAGATTTTVGGLLVDGPSYSFQIRAVDAAQRSGPSASFPAVTPVSQVPGAPRCAAFADADVGSTDVTVRWSLGPANGAQVDGFSADAVARQGMPAPVHATAGSGATSAKLSGLVPGVPYDVTVSATVGGAAGPACPPQSVTPYQAPAAATGVRVDSLDHGLTVTWKEPDDGGSPILDATVTLSPAPPGASSRPGPITVAGGTLTAAFPDGLSNGTKYTASVVLRNKRGPSPAATGSATPAGPIAVTTPGLSVPSDRFIASSFSVDWNGHRSGTCTMVVDGDGGSAAGSCTGFGKSVPSYAHQYSVHIEASSPDGATGSSNSAPVRTNDPPLPPSITIGKGGAYSSSACNNSSCAYVQVQLSNFPPNASITVDCDSDNGPFNRPYPITTDGNGNGSRGNYWFFGYPRQNVWCSANGVTSNHLRW